MSGLDSLLRRRPPTAWERFFSSPLLFLAQTIYSYDSHIENPAWDNSESKTSEPSNPSNPSNPSLLRIVCISDTHNTHTTQPTLPDGDLLIHAGDLTHSGTASELADALSWLSAQPHAHKVVIAGNHDVGLANPDSAERARILHAHPDLVYLEDELVTLVVRGRPLRIYGSPRTPKHGSWAFQYPRVQASPSRTDIGGANIQNSDLWAAIPTLTDVLVTHGPPFAHLDLDRTGCLALLDAVWRVRPRLHVFGHVHGARGVEHVRWSRAQKAYEDTACASHSRDRWGGLVRLMFWVLVEKLSLSSLYVWRSGGSDKGLGDSEGTIMVNAAAVGGLRDEQRRGAIVVYT